MLAPDTVMQGRYRVISQIGSGGMGTVYLAKDENLSVHVALKQSIFDDQRMIEAFKREARLLAGLRHPALPQVKDYFINEVGQFLVMEYISGDDFGAILEKRQYKIVPSGTPKPFEPHEVLPWAEQLLDALDYLHTLPEPVIHRDIKPQNLKLAGRNQIILLDFGLAKGKPLWMTRVTTTGSIYGYTPNYAPLEQIRGGGTDPRSDLYALGATLYHLLTGMPPVDAATRADAFIGGEPDPLLAVNKVNPQVPREISDILMKAMAQHRNQRSASASEILEMLRIAKFSAIIERRPRTAVEPSNISETVAYQDENRVIRTLEQHRRVERERPTREATEGKAQEEAERQSGGKAAGRAREETAREGSQEEKYQAREGLRPFGQKERKRQESAAEPDVLKELLNSFVQILPGEFKMGSEIGDADEKPVHIVRISRRFEIGKYEITQAQWEAVMGNNPSHFRGANLPVENVSWDDAQKFIKKLNARNDGCVYRLPTESEWEYACCAGTTTVFAYGDSLSSEQANFDGNYPHGNAPKGKYLGHPIDVGSYKPNAWGLYDMHGNVWEWCQDKYSEKYYMQSPNIDPMGPNTGSGRVSRGGSWLSNARRLRSASRVGSPSDSRNNSLGFRLVRTLL